MNDGGWKDHLIAFGPGIVAAAALIFLFWTGVL
jgi:hypothetical protein